MQCCCSNIIKIKLSSWPAEKTKHKNSREDKCGKKEKKEKQTNSKAGFSLTLLWQHPRNCYPTWCHTIFWGGFVACPAFPCHQSKTKWKENTIPHNQTTEKYNSILHSCVNIPKLLQQLTHDCRDKKRREGVEAGLGARCSACKKSNKITPTNEISTREEGFQQPLKPEASAKNITAISARWDK